MGGCVPAFRSGFWATPAARGVFFALLTVAPPFPQQADAQASLVGDIRGGTVVAESQPSGAVTIGGVTYFVQSSPRDGRELWRTDGTREGTRLVKDIAPAGLDGAAGAPVDVCGAAFLEAYHPQYGLELWKSDGTPAGTVLVRDITPGTDGSRFLGRAVLECVLLFVADDGIHGPELWRSDGTTDGTALVKDIREGGDAYGWPWPSDLRASGKNIYFVADDGIHGQELWTSDGTEAGTNQVRDICEGACSGLAAGRRFATVGGRVLFMATDGRNGLGLWSTDGSAQGTFPVKESFSGAFQEGSFYGLGSLNLFFMNTPNASSLQLWRTDGTGAGTFVLADAGYGAAAVGGSLFFTGKNNDVGEELWKTDGSLAGTTLVKDIREGPLSSTPRSLTAVGGTLFFTAYDGATHGQLWKSDGSAAGTSVIRAVGAGSVYSYPEGLFAAGERLFFRADDGVAGDELWTSDGTAAGTMLVMDMCPGPGDGLAFWGGSSKAALGGVVLFRQQFGQYFCSTAVGDALWRSDGTPGGTYQLTAEPPGSSRLDRAVELNGRAYFAADDGIHGREVWSSDGTPAGTHLLNDLCLGGYGSTEDVFDPKQFIRWSNPGPRVVGGRLFFAANDGRGLGLWTSDGTAGLPQRLPASGFVRELTDVAGTLFFTTDSYLWKSDGSPEGTAVVAPVANRGLYQGEGLLGLVAAGSTLFFANADEVHGRELWRSDGTSAGTFLVKDVAPGSVDSHPTQLAESGGRVFFAAFDPVHGSELWGSDGTEEGTVLVKDIRPWEGSSSPQDLVDVGSVLFFAADDGVHGPALWRSDGTKVGTALVKAFVSSPASLTNVHGTLFFTADDGASGSELWRSDGTSAGTVLVKDIWPGPEASFPSSLRAWGDTLYFAALHPDYGQELWRSDGTPAGTAVVADVMPGPLGRVTLVAPTASGVLFSAWDDAVGQELWRVASPLSVSVGDAWVREGDGTGDEAVFALRLSAVSASVVSVDYATADGSAKAGVDYRTAIGTVGFAPGETLRTVAVPVLADLAYEPQETFSLALVTASGAAISDRLGVGTILDDDPRVAIAVRDAAVSEGASGTTAAEFLVTLSEAGKEAVTVGYATRDGSAEAGSDYLPVSGTLSFAPGQVAQYVSVPILGDASPEANESFVLELGALASAVVSRGTALGTILDDDRKGYPARPQAAWHDFFAVDPRETPFVGDFDGDRRTDIVTFTRQNPLAVGDVYVALSEGTRFGPPRKWHDWFAISPEETVVIGDFDGDGKHDLGTWLGTTTRQVYVALSFGIGLAKETVWLDRMGEDAADVILAGDVNGDGKDDLVDFARTRGKVSVALSHGRGFLAPTEWHPFFAVSTYERPAVADVNADGFADIVTFATDSPTAFGDVYVATSDGAKFVDGSGAQNSDKWHDWFAISPSEQVRVGDLDGDGAEDFFTFLPLPWGQCYVVRSWGHSLGPNELWPEVLTFATTDVPFVGDVDGDGQADVIVFARSEGKVYVSLAR